MNAWEAQQRFNEAAARQISTMAPGNPSGRLRSAAQPAPAPPRTEKYRSASSASMPMWSWEGSVYVAAGHIWVADRAYTITALVGSLLTVGTTSTVLALFKNGVQQDTVTLAAADSWEVETASISIVENDLVQGRIVTAGTGAADAALMMRI